MNIERHLNTAMILRTLNMENGLMKKLMYIDLKFYLFAMSWLLAAVQAAAVTIQTSDIDKDGSPDYVIANKYYTAVLINPGAKSLDLSAPGVSRGGWFKEIVPSGSEKGFLASENGVKFGLTQVLGAIVFTSPDQAARTEEPGAAKEPPAESPKESAEPPAPAAASQPWQSSMEKKDNDTEVIVSFSQDVQVSKERSYKLRIDTKFSDTSKITIRGILFNNSKEILTTTVTPRPFFNISYEALTPKSWISIPIKRSFNVGDKKIVSINSDPIPISKMMKYTEYNEDRFSKAERWVSAGSIGENGVFAILTKSPVSKIAFWKDNDCFGIEPTIKIEVPPEQRVEWEWTLLFGKGLESVSKVTDAGIYSIRNVEVKDSSEVIIDYLPSKDMDGISLDLTLNSPEGKMIMNKNKEFAGISPLKPGSVKLNLPPDMKNKRYLLKFEFFTNDVAMDQFTHWLNPQLKTVSPSSQPAPSRPAAE